MNITDNNRFNRPVIYILSDIWSRLSRKRKFRVFLVLIVMLISSAAEILSLGMVIPYLSFLENPQNEDNFLIKNVLNILDINQSNNRFLFLTLIFIFIISLSAIIRLVNLYCNYNLSASIGSDISCKFFGKVINQEYQNYITNDSSKIINSATEGINITTNFILFVLQFLTSFIISLSILLTLISISWRVSLFIILIFGISYYLLSIFTRKIIFNNSKIINYSREKQIKTVQEGLGSMRDIIMDDLQGTYFNIYKKLDITLRLKQAESKYLGGFPRYAIEAVGVTIILLAGYFQSTNLAETDSIKLVPFLGTIAFAAQRLLPGFQNCYASFIELRSGAVEVEKVLRILNSITIQKRENIKNTKFNFQRVHLKSVGFSYKDSNKKILKNIDLTISKGEVLGIVGLTGCGKSTLLDVLMGLLIPSEGKCLIDGVNLHTNDHNQLIYKWRSIISHVPQNIFLKDDSFLNNIAFGIPEGEIDIKKVEESAKYAQIDQFIVSSKYGYRTEVGERGIQLSGGQKQRIGIARALYKDSKILILDEATSALDNLTENLIINEISNFNKEITIIMVAHRLSSLNNCNRIIKLENGAIH